MVFFFSLLFGQTSTQFRCSTFFCFSVSLPISFSNFIYPLFSVPYFAFSKILSPSQSTLAPFHRSVIGVSYMNADEKRGLKRDAAVWLLINMDWNATRVDTITMCGHTDDATNTVQRRMQMQSLAHDNSCGLIAICTAVIVEERKSHGYPYTFPRTEEVPSTLVDVYSPSLYAQDSQAMPSVEKPLATLPAFSPAGGRLTRGRQEQ